jgi:CubicO group peptidase (beta-lactamase class C family)
MVMTRRGLLCGVAGMAAAGPAVALTLTSGPPTPAGIAAAKAYSASRNGVSFLVMDIAGVILAEDYPNEGGQDRAWELASGTKSFAGVSLAAAVQDRLLRLDQPCADILTEWRGDQRKAITIGQLLSLTSGLGGGGIGRPPAYADAITTQPTAAPGARFAYGPTPFQVYGEILRRVTQGDPLAYYQRRLFDPIGVRPQRWRRGADGHPHLPSGAAFTARDWAAFGRMTLNGWRKDGRALLDPATLDANFQGTSANPGYGLTWWLLRPGLRGPSPRSGLQAETLGAAALAEEAVMAAGAGNQRLYLLRKRGLIVIRQASRVGLALMGRGPQWSDSDFLTGLFTSA